MADIRNLQTLEFHPIFVYFYSVLLRPQATSAPDNTLLRIYTILVNLYYINTQGTSLLQMPVKNALGETCCPHPVTLLS